MKVVIRELKMHVCLAGDYIFRGGDDGHCMFLLNQGSVGVYEDETFLHALEPGDTFGEGAVLSPDLSVRTESVIAEVRSVIYSLSRSALLRWWSRPPMALSRSLTSLAASPSPSLLRREHRSHGGCESRELVVVLLLLLLLLFMSSVVSIDWLID